MISNRYFKIFSILFVILFNSNTLSSTSLANPIRDFLYGSKNTSIDEINNPQHRDAGIDEILKIIREELSASNNTEDKAARIDEILNTIREELSASSSQWEIARTEERAEIRDWLNNTGRQNNLIMALVLISILTNYIFSKSNKKDKRKSTDLPTLKASNNEEKTISKILESHESMLEAFATLKDSLDEKDEDIKRLKGGYDLQILKNFVTKFIKVNEICDSVASDPKVSEETKEEIDFISEAILNAIDEIGIKRYSIKEGTSTKSNAFGIPPAAEWIKIKTNDKTKKLTVKKTIKEGFFIDQEKKEILRHAKIEVYIEG